MRSRLHRTPGSPGLSITDTRRSPKARQPAGLNFAPTNRSGRNFTFSPDKASDARAGPEMNKTGQGRGGATGTLSASGARAAVTTAASPFTRLHCSGVPVVFPWPNSAAQTLARSNACAVGVHRVKPLVCGIAGICGVTELPAVANTPDPPCHGHHQQNDGDDHEGRHHEAKKPGRNLVSSQASTKAPIARGRRRRHSQDRESAGQEHGHQSRPHTRLSPDAGSCQKAGAGWRRVRVLPEPVLMTECPCRL